MQKIILLMLVVCSALYAQTYKRAEWSVWIDADKDCQNTRQEVLIQESLIPVVMDESGCKVLSGLWLCLYTGTIVTDPDLLDIDHMVPLENTNASGGYAWVKGKKKDYANNLNEPFHLIAVLASANRSKGSKSLDKWMPSYTPFKCTYLKEWKLIKGEWNLTMTENESNAIKIMLSECN